MKSDPFSSQDDALVQATRGVVSRRQQIPPTPRDTLAVLRQAAEEQRTASYAPARIFHGWQWAASLALVAALLLTGWWWHITPRPVGPATGSLDREAPDLGLDLADWDLEFEALLTEIDLSLSAMADDDFTWMNGGNPMEPGELL